MEDLKKDLEVYLEKYHKTSYFDFLKSYLKEEKFIAKVEKNQDIIDKVLKAREIDVKILNARDRDSEDDYARAYHNDYTYTDDDIDYLYERNMAFAKELGIDNLDDYKDYENILFGQNREEPSYGEPEDCFVFRPEAECEILGYIAYAVKKEISLIPLLQERYSSIQIEHMICLMKENADIFLDKPVPKFDIPDLGKYDNHVDAYHDTSSYMEDTLYKYIKEQEIQQPTPEKKEMNQLKIFVNPYENGNIKGFASVCIGNLMRIDSIRIVENKDNKLFVCYPSYKGTDKEGKEEFKNIAFPMNKEAQEILEDKILAEYSKSLHRTKNVEQQKGGVKGYFEKKLKKNMMKEMGNEERER